MPPPGLQLDTAKLNMFWLGNYAQIPYRVFVSTMTGAERINLIQAEAEIRKKYPQSVMKTMNSELWIFSLEDKDVLLEPDTKFGLKETSTGIFLCSTLATADGPAPTAYKPFILSIKHLLNLCVLSSLPGSLLVENSVYLPDSQLLNIETFLSIDGDLYFRASIEHVSLISIERKPCSKNDSIFLTPIGITGSFLNHAESPAGDSPSADQLHILTGISNRNAQLFEKWINVEIEPGTVVTWPTGLALHYETNDMLTSWKSQKIQIDSLWDKLWINTKSMSKIMSEEDNEKKPVFSQHLRQKSTSTNAESSDTKSIQGASAVYPTPPDPQNLRSQKNTEFMSESKSWSPTNVNNNWGELDEELFGTGDGVTEADFDFFDQPEPSNSPQFKEESPQVKSADVTMTDVQQNSVPKEIEEEKLSSTPVSRHMDVEIKLGLSDITPIIKDNESMSDAEDSVLYRKRSRNNSFAPISFKKSIKMSIDMKYDEGGRFFLPNPDDDDACSDHTSSDMSSMGDGQGQAATPTSLPDDNNDNEMESTNNDHAAGSPVPDVHLPNYFQDELVSFYTQSGVKDDILKRHDDSQNNRNDEDTLKLIEVLLGQIVWDDGFLDGILPKEHYSIPPCQSSLNAIKNQFSGMTQLSLEDFLQSVSVSSQTSSNLKREGTTNIENNSIMENRLTDMDKQSTPFKARSQTYTGDDLGLHSADSDGYNARIGGATPYGQSSATQKILPTNRPVTEDVIQLPAPLYAFSRMQEPLKAREPILRFWKIFGLSPYHGAKDVNVVCCTPSAKNVKSFISPFLEQLQSCYEVCDLGSMHLLNLGDMAPGLFSMDMDEYDSENVNGESISAHAYEICAKISASLDGSNSKHRILFILTNPFNSIRSLMSLGKLMTCIKGVLGDTLQIGYQIIPLNAVYSSESLTVASQGDYTRLALQVYDRFSYEPLQQSNIDKENQLLLSQLYRNSPAYSLALIPPMKLNFRVAAIPPLSLLEEDTLMHVAYGISRDNRWAVVTWCDQWGSRCQMNIFSLGEKLGRAKAFEDMCAEVWDMTLKLCSLKPIKWRLAVVRAGIMEENEQRAWLRHIENSSEQMSAGFLLQCDMGRSMIISGPTEIFPYGRHVNERPQESLINTKSPLSGADVNSPSSRKPTDMDSPDTYVTNASTPGKSSLLSMDSAKIDSESMRVIDVENDVFGILFRTKIPLPPSGTLEKLRPTIGGLLLEHGSSTDEDRPLCGEFIILHTPANPVVTMKMLLFHYRQLASLACQTGVAKHTVQPWHIEAVMKILRLLNAM